MYVAGARITALKKSWVNLEIFSLFPLAIYLISLPPFWGKGRMGGALSFARKQLTTGKGLDSWILFLNKKNR
jgi:hypothetical protein